MYYITGKVPYKKKLQVEKQLIAKDVVILTNAACQSINLQAVNNVVFYNTPFATGWFIQCPIGSTRVLTPEGYRRVDTLPKDFKVVRKGGIYDAHILKSQKERIKGVVMSSGKEIEVSLGHKFLTVDGWKEVRDLALGDKIVVQKPIGLSGESKFDEV